MLHAGTHYAGVLACLSKVLGRLFAFPEFSAHGQQLLHDEQLCSGLLQLMLPVISAMAVGLQLPPERRPAECTWRTASHMAAFVAGCLRPMQQQAAIAAGPDAGRRLLTAAAQLLQCCPFPAPKIDRFTAHAALETTMFLIMQLEDAALLEYPAIVCSPLQPGQQPPSAPLVLELPRRQAQLLLAALPKFGEALAAVAQAPRSSLRHSTRVTPLIGAAATAAALLAGSTQPEDNLRPAAAMASVQDLPAWLRAAAAVLRWLPAVATIWEQQQLDRPGSVIQTRLSATASGAVSLGIRVGRSSMAGWQQPDAGWAGCSPAVRADCLTGLWELHTAACRAAHSLLSGAIPWPLVAQALPHMIYVYQPVEAPLLAASAMHPCKDGGAASLPPDAAR